MAIGERKEYGKWNVFQQSYSRAELTARRARLAKVANSRIRSLEKATSDISGEKLIEGSQFNTVQSYLESQGKKRFSESKKARQFNDFELKRDIVVLENFLSMQSSTVSGFKEVEQKRVQSFMDKGVPEDIATSKDFYDFLNSPDFQQLTQETLDSEDIIDIIERSSDSMSLDKILEIFQKHVQSRESGAKSLYQKFGLKIV